MRACVCVHVCVFTCVCVCVCVLCGYVHVCVHVGMCVVMQTLWSGNKDTTYSQTNPHMNAPGADYLEVCVFQRALGIWISW